MSRTVKRGDFHIPLKERLEPDPETAPVVVWMYEWIADGKTLCWVARALSGLAEGGIYKKPTPRQHTNMGGANVNGEWNESTIAAMLAFPGYMGRWPAYRTKLEVEKLPGSEHNRRVRITDESEWVWVEPSGRGSSSAPALVTPELWHRVQRRLSNNKVYSKRNRANTYGTAEGLLHTGMARCGRCGGRMQVKPLSHDRDLPDGTRVFRYECRAGRKNFPKCAGMSCLTEPLDRAVQLALVNALRDPETIARLARLARRSQDKDRARAPGITVVTPLVEHEALTEALGAKEQELTRLVERSATLADDDPALVGYKITITKVGAEVQAKREEVERARCKAEKYKKVEQVIGEWTQYLTMWSDNLDKLGDPYHLSHPSTRAAYRRWLEMLGARVTVHPE
jgi:hypothetical protein